MTKELLTLSSARKEALRFLQKQDFMSLATVDEKSRPHVATLIFFVDEDFNIYWISHKNTKKTDNIETSNLVAGDVHDKEPAWYVQFHGHVSEASEHESKNIIEEFAQRTVEFKNFWPPIFMQEDPQYFVYKITPTWLRLVDLSGMTISADPAPIYDIISPAQDA